MTAGDDQEPSSTAHNPRARSSTAAPAALRSTTPDVAALYCALAGRLERIVRHDVHAPDVVIEDACQFAWTRFVHHQRRVRRERVLGWLVTTAVHEALKLLCRSATEVSLEGMIEEDGDVAALRSGRDPEELVEAHERLCSVALLAPRQQRALWLRALGLSYGEIALRDGSTERTVERQLYRARARLRSNESRAMDFG